ncbi:MAG TPA: CAP domain-containing protein [Bacillus sp. (in: firmicutes)]|uniref:CAP domain-containing protein n=1 Tax=Bacillus litorisediminis TaxID=2922713 RepID=UPI001FAC4F8A|nr:CAP domain-containing protein [Bacillus litorisediminis]HWO74826.1 CAP domain-containing protein [Bacillus sp. (in: firmicutes)]
MIGKDSETVRDTFGSPDRIEPSLYGYDWWVYKGNSGDYFQVGIEDQKVVTAYIIGEDINVKPFEIGQPIQDIFKLATLSTDIQLDYDGTTYQFELTEEDLNIRPLIPIGDIFVQLYFDKFTEKLSSIRFMDAETLIKLRPYDLVYRGTLHEIPPLEEDSWSAATEAIEKQIFDMTNVIRERFGLPALEWDPVTAVVAYEHSKDMHDNEYFSHTSPEYGELKDRLEVRDVAFEMAGENIAAQYVDAGAVIEGWINSKGHRETMLEEEFTHLGVGVYRKYYTQNYIKRSWDVENEETGDSEQ